MKQERLAVKFDEGSGRESENVAQLCDEVQTAKGGKCARWIDIGPIGRVVRVPVSGMRALSAGGSAEEVGVVR